MGERTSPIPRLRRVLPHEWGRWVATGPIPRLRRVLPHEWGRRVLNEWERSVFTSPIPRLRRVLPHEWGRRVLPHEWGRSGLSRKRGTGQALVELALALPVLMVLVAGVLELGRGYAFAVETSDAARDAARYVAGKTATTNGPGLVAMCDLVVAELAAVTTNVSCPTQVNHAPPFVAATDYTKPVPGQAVVAVF